MLVTFLIGAFGVERFVNADQLNKRLSAIETQLATPLGGQRMRNYNEIYRAGAKICSLADEQIRTVVTVSAGPKAPDYFIDAIVQRLKERRESGYSVRYKVVLVLDEREAIDLNVFQNGNEKRLSLFEKNGVRDLVELYVLNVTPPISYDVLIVDRKHVNLALPSIKPGRKLETALVFENQIQVASDLADWFDSSVLPLAKPYEQWLKEQRSKSR